MFFDYFTNRISITSNKLTLVFFYFNISSAHKVLSLYLWIVSGGYSDCSNISHHFAQFIRPLIVYFCVRRCQYLALQFMVWSGSERYIPHWVRGDHICNQYLFYETPSKKKKNEMGPIANIHDILANIQVPIKP